MRSFGLRLDPEGQPGAGGAELFKVEADGGQRGNRGGGERMIVHTNDGDVLGHAHARVG